MLELVQRRRREREGPGLIWPSGGSTMGARLVRRRVGMMRRRKRRPKWRVRMARVAEGGSDEQVEGCEGGLPCCAEEGHPVPAPTVVPPTHHCRTLLGRQVNSPSPLRRLPLDFRRWPTVELGANGMQREQLRTEVPGDHRNSSRLVNQTDSLLPTRSPRPSSNRTCSATAWSNPFSRQDDPTPAVP